MLKRKLIKGEAMKRPTVEEINDYMIEREFFTTDQAETFFDHFESKGVGSRQIKNEVLESSN